MDPEPGSDPDLAAAELALGLLDADERAAALRRVIAEPAFAREVETWRAHFAVLFDQWLEEPAPANLFKRISQNLEPPRGRAGYWPAVAGGLALIAASLLLVVVLRPAWPPTTVPPMGPLVASLAGDEGGPVLPVIYDPARGELRMPVGVPAPAGRSIELWAIGEDGVPHSLGLLRPGGRTVIQLDAADRARIIQGVDLAVTREPLGGSPTGLPTGPVIANGVLISS
jgi:anti-sigma-K factor RskA